MNLNKIVDQFFRENEYNKISDRVLVLRYDGICVYSNQADNFETSSICALVSGAWQAAESMASLLKKKRDFLDFRFSFDTSSDGLYIVPFNIMGK